MNAQTARARIVDYVRAHARPVDKYEHQPRVYALAKVIAGGLVHDDDVLFAAAWLHDIGVFEGNIPSASEARATWDNVKFAVEEIPSILERLEFPDEKVPLVIACVAGHSVSASPASVEGLVLRDADILEQLGAVGIVRTVSKVGRDTRFSTHRQALVVLRKHSIELAGKLTYERSRQMAEKRLRVMRAFLDAADDEFGFDALASD